MLKFSKEHEWVKLDGDVAVVGISEFAQKALGDIVYVELPEIGRTLQQGKEAAVVESVKAASDVFAPISGEVVAINPKLHDDPSLVNSSCQKEGWLFKMRPSQLAELASLLDETAYRILTEK